MDYYLFWGVAALVMLVGCAIIALPIFLLVRIAERMKDKPWNQS